MLYSLNPMQTFTVGVLYTVEVDHDSYFAVIPLKKITLAVAASIPNTFSANINLKKIAVAGLLSDQSSLNITLPKLTVSAEIYSAPVALATITLPKLKLSGAVASSEASATTAIILPKTKLVSLISQSPTNGANITLGKIIVVGKASSAPAYIVDIKLNKLTVAAVASILPVYDAAITLSKITAYGRFGSPQTISENSSSECWLMNLQTKGHWIYAGFDFNSMTRHGDDYYLANSTGLHKLVTPARPTVVGKIVTPTLEFAGSSATYMHDAYIHCRGNNDLTFSTVTDEDRRVDYDVSVRVDKEGKHVKRVKLAKGVKGNNWSFELENLAGERLDISSIDLRPLVSQRSK